MQRPTKVAHRWTEKDNDTLRSMYPDHFNREIAQAIGCSMMTLARHIRTLGLKEKSDVHARRYSAIMSNTMKGRKAPWAKGRPKGCTWTEENKQAFANGLKRAYDAERRRVIFGLPQKTNLKVNPWKRKRKPND